MSENLAVIILAAGKGTRMKSGLVKVLHPLMGQPMLSHVINSARYLQPDFLAVVIGHQGEKVQRAITADGISWVRQEEQLGTGHAVFCAREVLADFKGTILILSGDVPLLSPQTMMDFLAAHQRGAAALSVLTVDLSVPGGYGRVIRDSAGFLERIVEARDAGAEELAVTEINAGIYAVSAAPLFEALGRLKPDNDQHEYYLTDVAADFRYQGLPVAAILCPDPQEVMGVNDRTDLAQAMSVLKWRTNVAWMLAGTTMMDPDSAYIETTVKLGRDVTLWPNTYLLGRTAVGEAVEIEPDCQIVDSNIGPGAIIRKGSIIEGIDIEPGAEIGPLAVMRRSNQGE
ncbi:MAG: NTP transferase domain-containing protein [Pseudomonadota bacterium]